jgi:hypothetical protein
MATQTATRTRRPSTTRRRTPIDREARALLAQAERETTALAAQVRARVDRAPWAAIGLGLAAGWVLGGGLTPRIGAALLAAAGRSAFAGALASAIRPVLEEQGR